MEQDTYAGVLSQTLTSSPCMKQVLSARVRTPHHNDVVMVGHSSIHLREFMPTGHLSNVIAHLELGTQILSARVISAEAHSVSVADPILSEGRDEIQFSIKGEPCDDTQPPQVVVLSTALSELVFVYAKILSNGSSQFVHARRHILGGRHWPLKYGKHLAVDMESRALAVASMKGSFGLLALKNLHEIKDSIDNWDPRDPSSILPITEQIFIQVDGVILRMDFLRSPVTNPRQVVLLLIVANQGTSRLLLYRWDSWQAIATTKPLKCSGYTLPTEDAFPHLLIPSCKALSFAIVTGHKLVFYDDITSHKKTTRVSNILPADDQKDKQWVQWAKAVRHEKHMKQKEDIFLIREDGLLRTTIVTHHTEQRAEINFEPGNLKIRVDTAVCALAATPTQGGDILIACGDTTDGGVFHLMARVPPMNLQSLANWSPITDVVLLGNNYTSSTSNQHVRMLAATGIHENRAFLTEIRYGIEAQIHEAIEYEDGATVDRLWILNQPSQGQQLLLTSHHEHTNIICLGINTSAMIAQEPGMYPRLGVSDPTLAACSLDYDWILQITTTQIHVQGVSEQSSTDLDFLKGNFVCADVYPETGSFVIANRDGQSIQLTGGNAIVRSESIIDILPLPQSLPIDYLPVSLTIATLAAKNVVMAGSQDGCLYLYDLSSEWGVVARKKWNLSSFHQDLHEPKISSIAILSLPDASRCLVVCGLKTGQFMVFEMAAEGMDAPEAILLTLNRFQTIGSTAVSISVEVGTLVGDEKSAYVFCDNTMSRVHLYRNTWGLDFTVDSLLITAAQQDQNASLSSSFNAVARIERASPSIDGPMCGLLAAVTENALLLLRLGQSALIPRQISQVKPTHHLVYSSQLKRCIASVTGRKGSYLRGTTPNSEAKPSLQILDPDGPQQHEDGPRVTANVQFGEAGEKVRALLWWMPTNGETHYEMVVVGSNYRGDGRLSYITAKRLSQNRSEISATMFITYAKKPISAICEYGLSSLLVCAGRELKLVHLDMSAKPTKWEHQAEIELPSRATELRTKGSVVYVATSLHSYMLIRVQDKKLEHIGSASWAGKARNVLPYGNSSTLVNLVSDQGSRILSFGDRLLHGNRPSFEATVPEAIDKLISIKSPANSDAHKRFLGTTIDGTVYMFTTLNEREMRLLAFLEQLCQPIRDQAARSASVLAHRIIQQYGKNLESAGIATPSLSCTHARGDVLKALLTPGPYNIYSLLRKRVKVEDDITIKTEDELEALQDVARPVLGHTGDVVEGVILWLRRLLNVPSF